MNEKPSKIPTVVNVVVGLVSIASMIFVGGSGWARLSHVEEKVSRLETAGSVGFQRHEDVDNERVKNLAARMANVEAAILSLGGMQADIREIKTKVEQVQLQQQKQYNKP